MGWKNVKEHYRIGHIVQVRDGCICIGSSYVPDLIRVAMDGAVSWGNLGPPHNTDLARYFAEMTADIAKLRELIETPDVFRRDLVVYTYDGAEIIKKLCEDYGWPNVCHDGQLQYDNTHFREKADAVCKAKREAAAGIACLNRSVQEATQHVNRLTEYRLQCYRDAEELEMVYPVENDQVDMARSDTSERLAGNPEAQ